MLVFTNEDGGIAIPIQEYDKLQQKNLKLIKDKGMHIPDLTKVSVYYPEIRFKNVSRLNEDGTIDVIVNSAVSDAFGSGFLPKPFYKAMRVKSEKTLLGLAEKWTLVEMLQVPEREIIGTFTSSFEIEEITDILEELTEKGVKYFD